MKPYIQIALATGHVFEVKTDVIAKNRAAVMLAYHPDEFKNLDEALVDTVELFDDADEIRDWALNNMNPPDYIGSARLVRFIAPEQDFNTSEWSYHDQAALMGELDGEQILRQPVEAVLSVLAASGQLCNVTVLNGEDGKPFGMMAVVIGNEPIVGAFISTLQYTAGQLSNGAPALTH